jgi:oligopeptide/dipeptide ABC transporter ATP-binding protein
MYSGRIVERAPVRAIFDAPQHPYTVGLLGSIPRLDVQRERLASIEGQVPNPLHRPPGCNFADRCPFAIDKCRAQVPPLMEVGTQHLSACWRAPLDADVLVPHPSAAMVAA